MCIRYKGKLVDQYKARFGKAPIKSVGIRWWIVFEQAMQLYEHGVMNVLEDVVSWGIDNNASLNSCESMIGDFSITKHDECERMALILIETAAVSDGGQMFAVMTYVFEGNDPLILSAYRAF